MKIRFAFLGLFNGARQHSSHRCCCNRLLRVFGLMPLSSPPVIYLIGIASRILPIFSMWLRFRLSQFWLWPWYSEPAGNDVQCRSANDTISTCIISGVLTGRHIHCGWNPDHRRTGANASTALFRWSRCRGVLHVYHLSGAARLQPCAHRCTARRTSATLLQPGAAFWRFPPGCRCGSNCAPRAAQPRFCHPPRVCGNSRTHLIT